MITVDLPETPQTHATQAEVMLANGEWLDIAGRSQSQLEQLQWEQERAFAGAIKALPAGSRERAMVTGQAYDTVCQILAAQQGNDQPLVMGLDPRYTDLVLSLLRSQVSQGIGRPRFFEVGYGCGALLKEVSQFGYPVGGVEISSTMRDQALGLLGKDYEEKLLLGDLRNVPVPEFADTPSLLYWNDVFEHICPDEIGGYLSHLYRLLIPGGSLVTITPNWLLRPSDVTVLFCPPRTEAQGLHMKEYRLAEVTRLLKAAGFRRVATPLVVTPRKIYLAGGGLCRLKQLAEPLLEKFSVKYAHLACRGLGLSYTIATK